MYRISILIRKTINNPKFKTPKSVLCSHVNIIGDYHLPFVDILIIKGMMGNNATIARNENAFAKYLVHNYGSGRFYISIVNKRGKHKGFNNFWIGNIEPDRYFREKGSISPYLESSTPRVWHVMK